MARNAVNAEQEQDAPAVVEALLRMAEAAGASDVHLQSTGQGAQITLRLDGVMVPLRTIDSGIAERVFGRIKFLARLKTYQDTLPQEGRIDKAEVGCRSDLRVSTYPTVSGEKIVLRLFQESAAHSLPDLGFPPALCTELEGFLRQSTGLLLLTGPAGSGKTTTIYACLRHLVSLGGRHIITVEDPVEQIVPDVMQTEVNEPVGLTFAKAARHLLRQDPQVLVIGEIRDEETAGITLRAALTGHLVIATLHAGSCRRVAERLMLLSADRYAVTSALELVVNQRLVRRFCAQCTGSGCPACLGTGYKGRVPVLEWVRLDERARQCLHEKGPETIHPAWTLAKAGQQLLEQRVTSAGELERCLGTANETG